MSAQKKRHDLLLLILLLFGLASAGFSQSVPGKYEEYIKRFPDNRTLFERLLNKADLTLEEIGPGFALVAGIDTYPNLAGRKALRPAGVDVDKLLHYLKGQERFIEIVVLRNEAVTLENLDYFLQRYFPRKLQGVPNGRFLLAFSGHGIQEGEFGFLLKPDAERLEAEFGISLDVIKGLYGRILQHAHQSLVLINACHGGAFLEREAFGRVVPRDPGHWAITAGGDASELVWHDKKVGPGSIFFEKLFAALDGRADRLPEQPDGLHGDGLVTVEELFSYLKMEVQIATDQSQNPRMGNISPHGDHGSFFFFDRRRPIAPPPPKPTPPTVSFGGQMLCGSGDECFSMGEDAHDRKEYAQAQRLYWEACQYGDVRGYTSLGILYEKGRGVKKDHERAATEYRKGCDGGHALGCARLGTMYTYGQGVKKDKKQAVKLYRQACDQGSSLGCCGLGYMYEYGNGGLEKDKKRAVNLFSQGCDGGHAWCCGYLGVFYDRGGIVAEDTAKAVRLYTKACNGGDARSCTNLGIKYLYGSGVPKDPSKAKSLFRLGCDNGDKFGCEKLRTYRRTGFW